MRARTRPDDNVAEAAQRRLEALVAELGGHPPVREDQGSSHGDIEVGGTADLERDDERDDDGGEVEDEVFGRHARRPLPSKQRAASWAGDRLPANLAGLRLGGRHLAVIAVLLLAGVVLAGWSYLQMTGGPRGGAEVAAPRHSGGVEVMASQTSAGPATTAAGGTDQTPEQAAAGSASTAPAEVVVDVEGKVRRPGIAVLPAGSRVADALEAVGGARPG